MFTEGMDGMIVAEHHTGETIAETDHACHAASSWYTCMRACVVCSAKDELGVAFLGSLMLTH